MLDSIESVHNRGFIHRDVKAVSFFNLDSYSEIVKFCALSGQQASVHSRFWACKTTSNGRSKDTSGS